MTKLHCPEPLDGIDVHVLFHFRFPDRNQWRGLFTDWPTNFFEHEVTYVPLEEASAIILPHNFRTLPEIAQQYISHYVDLGEQHNIPVFVFSHADFSNRLQFDPRVWVLRYSIYRNIKRERDIMTPTYIEDLGVGGITPRNKGEIPTVSFCGKAGFPTLKTRLAYYARNFWYGLQSLYNPPAVANRIGIYWRRAAIRACTGSPLIRTHFIIRRTFSAHKSSIEMDAGQARQEFIDSIVNADFVLAPKGDGNYSNRFQETLAMGRIPVYVETDSVLPLEGIVPYEDVIVRVPYWNIKKIPVLVRRYWDSIDDAEYQRRQRMARELYEKYVDPDAFYRYVFTQALPAGTLELLNP